MAQTLIPADNDWQARIRDLQALLDEIRPQLIDAEARLAERLAAISTFEFQLRARIQPLVNRLEGLQNEIKQLRQRLRQMQEDYWFFTGDTAKNDKWVMSDWDFGEAATAAAQGDYRYMGSRVEAPPKPPSADRQETIKKLYRQLARRFHPDLALNEADREYRTDLMMRINAAYAAADLEGLQQLASEPDSPYYLDETQPEQQQAEALARELAHCQRRLQEIAEEFARLEKHRSTLLLRRVQQAAARGRDLIAEMMKELQQKITQKLVERDFLQQEMESFAGEELEFADSSFADTIYNLNLEQIFEDDADLAAEDWHRRRRDSFGWEDDPLDESES